MRLKLIDEKQESRHEETVTSVVWTREGDVFATSDDKTISVRSAEGEVINKCLAKMEHYITDIDLLPQVGTKSATKFAVAFTSGNFALVSKSGKIERVSNKSHHGVITSIRWNGEGNAIATAGEDGSVRVYSGSAVMRSTITRSEVPVYGVCWSPDNDRLLYTQGKNLVVRSLKVDSKKTQWKAHDGFIMKVDWNLVNDKIVSCGEDCKYKVWDSFGRMLYQSESHDHVLTSVRWSPNGSMFAVGAYDLLRLCDEKGWSHNLTRPDSGSLFNLAWASDGTSVAGAGGNGSVVIAQVVNRRMNWKHISVELVSPDDVPSSDVSDDVTRESKHGGSSPGSKHDGGDGGMKQRRHRGGNCIRVKDVARETSETLDFVDRVVEMSIGYGYLIVVTATRCFLYSVKNWNTPHIFDLPHPVSLIKQSARFFVLLNAMNGVHVYNYEGRHLSTPKFKGLRVQCLSNRTLSVAGETLAVLDRTNHKRIHIFDIVAGKAVDVIEHASPVVEIDLSRFSRASVQLISIVDTNRDLYLCKISRSSSMSKKKRGGGNVNTLEKIATMVDTSEWNDTSDMLTAVVDGKLMTWIYPQAVFVDRELFASSVLSRSGDMFGKSPYIASFFGSRVTIRRADGALMTTSVIPYAKMLYDFVASTRWDEAVRLCRFVKQDELWSALAAMAVNERHLDTAEIALAATSQMDKLQYITYIKSVPSSEGRAAELALFKRKPDEAEKILLEASPPLVYRAIKMNIRLFRWQRALDIATKYKTHIDTVLGYRERFLSKLNRAETNAKFIRYEGKVTVDWEKIDKAKEEARENEKRRGGSQRNRD